MQQEKKKTNNKNKKNNKSSNNKTVKTNTQVQQNQTKKKKQTQPVETKPVEINVEQKEAIKQTYYNEWISLGKRYYNERMYQRFVKGIDARLSPESLMPVSTYAEDMNNLLGILELARMGEIEKAEQLYTLSGATYMDRIFKFSRKIGESYYLQELLNVLQKDLTDFYGKENNELGLKIKHYKSDAKNLKSLGTVELNELTKILNEQQPN